MANVAPTFTQKPSLRQEGTSVVFSCEIEANPRPSISWYRGATALSEESGRIRTTVQQVDGTNKYTLGLVVLNASADDSGTYKVEVKNDFGQMSANMNLNLQGHLSGGELFEKVASDDYKMTETEVVNYIRQVCEGLENMHENNIVHLDIKPENILCETRKSTNIKLIDFGLATKLDPEHPVKVTMATADFAAPEVVEHEPVGFYTDMWSLGVLAYVLISGLSPFSGEDDVETLHNISKCSWDFDVDAFKGISENARDFIRRLLTKQPQRRLTVHEALEHPWLAGNVSDLSTHRIPSSRYHKIRDRVRQKYADWPAPMPAIGRIANFSSVMKNRPKDYHIYESFFDRREAFPRFVRKPHSCVVQEGSVANFKCRVIAATPPVINWYFNGVQTTTGLKYMPKYAGNDYELRISRIKMEDKGEYMVRATNSYGSREETALLNVEPLPQQAPRREWSVEPTTGRRKNRLPDDIDGYKEEPDKSPAFSFPLRDRYIQAGIGVKLLASLTAKPPPKVVWLKDGKEIKPKDDHYETEYSVGVASLSISHCDVNDAGRYTCRASNSKGEEETSCKVTVEAKSVGSSSTTTSSYSERSVTSKSATSFSHSHSSVRRRTTVESSA